MKHQPMRTCVVCRDSRPKAELLRVIRRPDGQIELDHHGKKPGRGAYLCRQRSCVHQALANRKLERALETAVPYQVRAALEEQFAHASE